MRSSIALLGLASLALQLAAAKVYFREEFDQFDTTSRWVQSRAKNNFGRWELATGALVADPAINQGLQTKGDSSYFALSAALEEPFKTYGKPLVLQYSVRFDRVIDCSGSYIKLYPANLDQLELTGESPFSVMFGPDMCGSSHFVKVLLSHKGKNYEIKKAISPINDQLTHLYTLIIKPNRTYQILIDNKRKAAGRLVDDFDFVQPESIPDTKATKPADWDDRLMIPDPEATPPADWVDHPQEIPDPEAQQPEEWDDDMDGPWEAPLLANPAYLSWNPPPVKNPNYQGPWSAPDIPNPKYNPKAKYLDYTLGYLGFDLWQVTSGVIMDNILVTDDVDYAKEFADATFTSLRKLERRAKKA
ncbi:Calreticulin precursor, partial [Dimargaris cristalligena]